MTLNSIQDSKKIFAINLLKCVIFNFLLSWIVLKIVLPALGCLKLRKQEEWEKEGNMNFTNRTYIENVFNIHVNFLRKQVSTLWNAYLHKKDVECIVFVY